MHKPLPGRLINAALPGPSAMELGLIGIATCMDSAHMEGMLCMGKCVARILRDGALRPARIPVGCWKTAFGKVMGG